MPLLYRISTAPGKKLRPDFLRFLFSLPEDKRQRYLESITRVGAKAIVRSPRVPVPPTPQALEREESLGGEWSIMP